MKHELVHRAIGNERALGRLPRNIFVRGYLERALGRRSAIQKIGVDPQSLGRLISLEGRPKAQRL